MKTTTILSAAVLALAGAAAAFAGPIRATGPSMTDMRAPPIQIHAPADWGVCALRSNPYVLEAFAAPVNAARWSLEVRAPGFAADQGGPLFGDARIPDRVSRITLVRDQSRGAPAPDSGPVHAELTLYDHDGRIVCVDRMRRGPSRW